MLSKEIKSLVIEAANTYNFTKEMAGSEMMAAMAFVYHTEGYNAEKLCAIADAYGLADMKLTIVQGEELLQENLKAIAKHCLEEVESTVMEIKTHKGFKALKKSVLPAHQVMCRKFKQELVRVPVRDGEGNPLEEDGRPVMQDKIIRFVEVSAIGTSRYDKDDMNNVILNITGNEDKGQSFSDSVVTVQLATESGLKLLTEEGCFFYKDGENDEIRLAIPDSDLSGVKFIDFLTLKEIKKEEVAVVKSLFFPGQASSNKKATLKFYLGDMVEVIINKLEKEDVFKKYVSLVKNNETKKALKLATRLGQQGTQSVSLTKDLPVAFVVDANGDLVDLKLLNGTIKGDGYMAGNGSVLVSLFNSRVNSILDAKGLKNVNILESAITGLTIQVRPENCKASCEILNKAMFAEYVNIVKSQGLNFVFSNCSCIEDAAVTITSSVAKTGVFSFGALEVLAFSHNGNVSNTSIQSMSQIVTSENADRIASLCIEKLSSKINNTLFSTNEVLGLSAILNKRAMKKALEKGANEEELLNTFVTDGALSVPSVRGQLTKSLVDLLGSSVSGHSYPLEGGSGTLVPFLFDDVLYYENGETNLFIPKLSVLVDKYNKAVAALSSNRASEVQKIRAQKIVKDLENKYVFEKSKLGYYNLISYVVKYPAVGKHEFVIAHCMGTKELRKLLSGKVTDIEGVMNHYTASEPNSIHILDDANLQKDMAGSDFDFDHASFVVEKEFVIEAVAVRRNSSHLGCNVEELKNGTVKEFLAKNK